MKFRRILLDVRGVALIRIKSAGQGPRADQTCFPHPISQIVAPVQSKSKRLVRSEQDKGCWGKDR